MVKTRRKPELLAPAGDWISLRAAIDVKADAVYFGIQGLNMRAGTQNFKVSDLKKIADACHKNSVKAYLALNIIVYQDELKRVNAIIKKAKEAGIDAVIAWDFSVLKACRDLGMRIHLSTQASVSNFESAKYYYERFGVKRIVLARECSLPDVIQIIGQIRKEKINLEIETFVHGAMCVSVSGRCFMSQFLFNKSANRGECLQPCRRKYIIKDPEEDHELKIGNNYVLSPKDLCTLPFLDQLIDAGINSFKIEGRNRSPEYVGTVTQAYRKFIDSYCSGAEQAEIEELKRSLQDKIKSVYNRGFSSGFFFGKNISEWTDNYGSKATTKKSYVGKVLNYFPKAGAAEILVETQKIRRNDKVMFQGPTTGVFEQTIVSMQVNLSAVDLAIKRQKVAIKVEKKVRKNDKVYLISSV